MKRKFAALSLGASAAVLLSGCSFFGGYVEASEVETEIAKQVESETGTSVTIDCPEDLEAEEDSVMVCQLTSDGEELSVDVTVDKVDGSDVDYSFLVVPKKG